MTAKQKRDAKIAKYLENERDDGRFGRQFELECARNRSQKTGISKQGEKDNSIKIQDASGIHYHSLESKTGGGRIDNMDSEYIAYYMKVNNKNTQFATREIIPVVMRMGTFFWLLRELDVIKEIAHGGIVDGHGIQVSNKNFFLIMDNYPLKFSNKVTYTDLDFMRAEQELFDLFDKD